MLKVSNVTVDSNEGSLVSVEVRAGSEAVHAIRGCHVAITGCHGDRLHSNSFVAA